MRYSALLRPSGFRDASTDVPAVPDTTGIPDSSAITTAADTSISGNASFTLPQLFLTSVAAGVTVGLIMKFLNK